MIVIDEGPKFMPGDSVSKAGAGTIPGWVIMVLPPRKFSKDVTIKDFWYAVRWADGNEDVYSENELWLAV